MPFLYGGLVRYLPGKYPVYPPAIPDQVNAIYVVAIAPIVLCEKYFLENFLWDIYAV